MVRRLVLVAAALLVLAGCGDDEPLADDPNGAEACRQWIKSFEAGDDMDATNEATVAAIAAAMKAETEDIRTAPDPDDLTPRGLDMTQLTDACEAAGFDVPD